MTSKPTSPDEPRAGISRSVLLQVNATVIAGVLIFLTVSSLGEVTTYLTALLAATIVIPFSVSSIIIIKENKLSLPNYKFLSNYKRTLSAFGFVYLAIVIVFLAYNQVSPIIFNINTPAEKCAIDPKSYNITHAADCSKFTPRSLAEKCALDPGRFHVALKQCASFIEK